MPTVLYYTSNREKPEFEQKIIDDLLLKKGDLPLISVSQKPMDLGQNICVGDVGFSYINEWKQILIGAKAAITEYLVMAESDFLYSPEYFQFEPKGENIYQYDNIWVLWLRHHDNFRRKRRPSEGAQYVKRDYFIGLLENFLKDYPGWYDESFRNRNPHSPYHKQALVKFHGEIPCISIKTSNGLGYDTGVLWEPENIRADLPYWGNENELRNKFL